MYALSFGRAPWLTVLTLVGCTGCLDGALLIRPVSGRQALEQHTLQRDSFFALDKIALIDVSGVLINGDEPRLLGSGENRVSLLLENLNEARQDPAVKAVILRINSPGGTVVASELMHDEITYFREKTDKPVIAVMMDVAASGGYYVACACDEIVAQPSTVTGSIGVIMQMFDVTGTMSMIGVSSDAITSGPRKDAGSPFRKLKDEERAIFQSMVDDMYGRFVEVVDEGRPNLSEAEVRKLADGRVYTASQALEAGLIDRIATLRETYNHLKEQEGIGKARLVTYKRPYAYRPNYYAAAPTTEPTAGHRVTLEWPALTETMTPRFMYLWSPGQ